MSQFYELGIKTAAPLKPYSGPGGGTQFAKDLGVLSGFKMPKSPSLPTAAKPPMGGASATPAMPSSPGANVPGGAAGAGPVPPANRASVIFDAVTLPTMAASAGAMGMDAMGMKVPGALQRFSGYRQGRSWGNFGKSLLPQQGSLVSKALTSRLGSKIPYANALASKLPMAGRVASGVGGKAIPFVSYIMEGMDAAGALPQWLGGTGIGNFGWSNEADFRQQTSLGGPGENIFGYSGPGWQALNGIGASLNAGAAPTRSILDMTHHNLIEAPSRWRNNAVQWFKNRNAEAKLKLDRANATPFTADRMNQMAKGQGGFYMDENLGHMMPTADYFNSGTSEHDDIWRRRVAGAAGEPGWQPAQ